MSATIHRGYDPTKGDLLRFTSDAVPVCALVQAITFANEGAAVAMGTIPKGARVLSARAVVTTAFNDTGTDLVNIGTAASAGRFASDLDVSGTGIKEECNDPGALAADTEAQVLYDGQNNNASAGAAVIVIEYVLP